ncbi:MULTISPECIES: DUF1307 domain-containing protein [unclassified Lacticaseibacillus]|uniref:DUF1307 domain-containing protein n=1 Tax=unclassified Lacticaseibacillus TaxID=2759744 RepID=UPI0019404475|nr:MULTISPECIES: DUF1307 domain-containing protein [unclassified Lacticaseibacillus]
MKRPAASQPFFANLTRWFGVLVLVLLLAGCSQAVKKTVFEKSGGGETTTMVFYTRGRSDRVDKQVTTLDLDFVKIVGKSAAKKEAERWRRVVRADAKAHDKLRGVTANATFAGTKAREVVTVDPARASMKKLAQADGQPSPGKVDHISLDNVSHTLEQDGYKKVKR